MKIPTLSHRDNLVDREDETWRPPRFEQQLCRRTRFLAMLRRFLDLQAASIWSDVRIVARSCAGTVVDVGCGAQPYRPLFASDLDYRGIDTADARAHFGYDVPDTLYFSGDRWPLADGTADVVLATETLEHVVHPADFLAESRRCLKSDGCLVLTVPFAARWHYIPHDYWRFTPSGLRLLLEAAGFCKVSVYARGNATTVACYKAMALILMLLLGERQSTLGKWAGRAAGIAGLPLLFGLAMIGQASLRTRGGNDCLGYTVFAAPAVPPGRAECVWKKADE